MITEAFSSLFDHARERIRNPLAGAFIIAWIPWNYKTLLYAVSNLPVNDKIAAIGFLYAGVWTGLSRLLVYPFLVAAAVTAAFPFVSYYIVRMNQKGRTLLHNMQQEFRATEIVSAEAHQKVRQRYESEIAELKRSNAELSERLDTLHSRLSEQDEELNKRSRQIELLGRNNMLDERVASDEGLDLISNEWSLHFNPKANGTKKVTFNPDGTVGTGQNENEHKWRLTRNNQLEFLNSRAQIHSRFSYDASTDRFLHTGDEDVINYKGYSDQYMVRAGKIVPMSGGAIEDSGFGVGDVVTLKSGGPRMTVEQVRGEDVLVSWFGSSGKQESGRYRVQALKRHSGS